MGMKKILSSGSARSQPSGWLPGAIPSRFGHMSCMVFTYRDADGVEHQYHPYIPVPPAARQTPSTQVRFTHEMLAWGLAGAAPAETYLILRKYGGGSSGDLHKFRVEVLNIAHELALREGWPMTANLPSIATTAADEVLSPTLCRRCQGHRFYRERKDGPFVECDPPPTGCGATGFMRWSQRRRARESGMEWRSFRRNGWDRRYERLLRHLQGIELAGLKRIAVRSDLK